MRAILGIGMTLVLVGNAQAGGYEMADLQALDKSGSYDELVQHLSDIAPSKRDKKWSELAERATSAQLAALKVTDQDPDGPLHTAENLLKSYPQLKQSKVFMSKRAETGLQSFKFNYSRYRHSSGDDEWIDKMMAFVKADDQTPDLPLRAAKLVISRLVPMCAYPFFKMVYDKGGPATCKDGDFQKTIVSAFEYGVWKAEITEIAQNKCWNEMKGPLVGELSKNKSEIYRRNICPVLKAKNGLPAAQKAECEEP